MKARSLKELKKLRQQFAAAQAQAAKEAQAAQTRQQAQARATLKRWTGEDAPDAPVTGAVLLSVKIYRAIPKSMPKYKREAALSGRLRPTTKPDVVRAALRRLSVRPDIPTGE